MRYIIAVLGFILVLIVLWDAFETIISPRRITSRFRFARFFYSVTWWSRSDVAQRIKDEKRRETYLSMFGPLSLLVLSLCGRWGWSWALRCCTGGSSYG